MPPEPSEAGTRRASTTERRYAVRTRVVVIVTCLLPCVSSIAAYPLIGGVVNWLDLLVLATIVIVSSIPRRTLGPRRVSLTLLGVILLAAIPLGAGVGIGLLSLASIGQLRTQARIGAIFNIAMAATIGMVGAVCYALVGAPSRAEQTPTLATIGEVAVGLLVADIAQLLANAALMSAILWASSGASVRAQFVRLVRSGGLTYLASGGLALLIYVAWVPAGGGPLSIILLIPALIATRWALATEREVERAQTHVVNAIATALEARTPGGRAHAEEVVRVCERLAEELALPPNEAQDVALAGAIAGVEKLCTGARRGPVTGAGGEDRPGDGRPFRALGRIEHLDAALALVDGRAASSRNARIVALAGAFVTARDRAGGDAAAAYADLLSGTAPAEPPDATLLVALGRIVTRLDPRPEDSGAAESAQVAP